MVITSANQYLNEVEHETWQTHVLQYRFVYNVEKILYFDFKPLRKEKRLDLCNEFILSTSSLVKAEVFEIDNAQRYISWVYDCAFHIIIW